MNLFTNPHQFSKKIIHLILINQLYCNIHFHQHETLICNWMIIWQLEVSHIAERMICGLVSLRSVKSEKKLTEHIAPNYNSFKINMLIQTSNCALNN